MGITVDKVIVSRNARFKTIWASMLHGAHNHADHPLTMLHAKPNIRSMLQSHWPSINYVTCKQCAFKGGNMLAHLQMRLPANLNPATYI